MSVNPLMVILSLTLMGSMPATASGWWPYRSITIPSPTESDREMSCVELEHEISRLSHQTYRYKPDFHSDPFQGVAVLAGSTVAVPALIVPLYSSYAEYHERSRVYAAEDRIDTLRLVKAEKQCFID